MPGGDVEQRDQRQRPAGGAPERRRAPPLARVRASSAHAADHQAQERKAQGCTSSSASFIIGQLTPQVTVSATSSSDAGARPDALPAGFDGAGAAAGSGASLDARRPAARGRSVDAGAAPQKSVHRPPFSQSP